MTEDDAAALTAAAVTMALGAWKGYRAAMTYWGNKRNSYQAPSNPRLSPHLATLPVTDRHGQIVVEAGGSFHFGKVGAFGLLLTHNNGTARAYECAPLSGCIIGDAVELVPIAVQTPTSLPFAAPGGAAASVGCAYQAPSGLLLTPQPDGSYLVGGG